MSQRSRAKYIRKLKEELKALKAAHQASTQNPGSNQDHHNQCSHEEAPYDHHPDFGTGNKLRGFLSFFVETVAAPIGVILYLADNWTNPVAIVLTCVVAPIFVHGLSRFFRWKRWKWIVSATATLSLLSCLVWLRFATPDEIKGTRYSRSLVSEIFPYGYTLVFLDERGGRRLEHHHDSNPLIKYEIAWPEASIKQDVAKGTVVFELHLDAKPAPGPMGLGISANGVSCVFSSKLEVAWMALGSFILQGAPTVHALTLSSNQRNPVFAVGFRIPTNEDLKKMGLDVE